MNVLTAAEMQACDRATTEQYGIPSLQLMRNAGAAVADFARRQFPRARRIAVLCGRGNNGGDGMMAARLLAGSGLQVTVLLLGSPDGLKGDAAEAWRKLQAAANCRIAVIEDEAAFAQHNAALQSDLILDAILGTGFKPPMRGLPLAALHWLQSGAAPTLAPVLAIDLPSGWPADETRASIPDPVFPADAVITFTAPKPAHVFSQLTRRWNQPVVIAPIGSPLEAIVSAGNLHWAGAAQSLLHAPRPADSNKGNYGHVLVVGGTFGSAGGKAGAPSMSSLAALRVGAGLVSAAVPAAALPIVASFAPELMTSPLETTSDGHISPANLAPGRLADFTRGITVLALGPGLGQSDATADFCLGLLEATTMPAVLDADALNLLAKHPDRLSTLARGGRTVILTPHPGEMARLAGLTTAEVQADRLGIARGFAARHGVTLVLKGARTIVAHPDGRTAVNTSGNPGMAKGGSGDILTGIVAGLLAQFPRDPAHAVEAAVWLHGLAADLTVRDADEHTLLATDILSRFSSAFRFHSRAANGYLWLQGLPDIPTTAMGSSEAAE
ncbi:MAG TPA: NAD(P)H-hydrate dehydratase [Terracidiphilus sp.]|nr:NAD(P)H-hydrate dehydratase [Terracidiphilus sp.]